MKYSIFWKIAALLALLSVHGSIAIAKLRVGDPGVTFDLSGIEDHWESKVSEWVTAGVRGGIPYLSDLKKGPTVDVRSSAGINAAIAEAGEGEYVFLPNGEYTITDTVNMKSRVYLVGESRDGVVCTITKKTGYGFHFNGVSHSGIYNLTIQGGWGNPKYDWNYGQSFNEELPDVSSWSVALRNGTSDCHLDNVKILNSGEHPLRCNARHNTFRGLHIDGCHNKAGGAQAYFFIQNSHNLITDCYVTRLRHISLQGSNVDYNVVYGNDFEQEVSFHSGDNGNNLIERNKITLPADMPGHYYAIMGPWSSQHALSAHPNYIYKNKCVENNGTATALNIQTGRDNDHKGATPWSDDSKIYDGPYKVKPIGAEAIYNNFRAMPEGKVPSGGTLYPVVLDRGEEADLSGFRLERASDQELLFSIPEPYNECFEIRLQATADLRSPWKTIAIRTAGGEWSDDVHTETVGHGRVISYRGELEGVGFYRLLFSEE